MGKRYRFRGRPDPLNRDRHRCGAKLHLKLACCRRWPVKGKKRCRLHGGLSTGAKTPEGKAKVLAVLTEGRQRWIAQMKAEGKNSRGGERPAIDGLRPQCANGNASPCPVGRQGRSSAQCRPKGNSEPR
jgi:hypothetical protein